MQLTTVQTKLRKILYMCKREASWVKQLAGEQCKVFLVREHVNIHILLSLLWDHVHTVMCEKWLVRIEESVLLQVVCTGLILV